MRHQLLLAGPYVQDEDAANSSELPFPGGRWIF